MNPTPPTPPPSPNHALDTALERWVTAGLITTDQASAIQKHEAGAAALSVERVPGGLPLGAELAIYLGSIVALGAGAAAIGRQWRDLPFVARIGLAVAIAVLGLFGGGRLNRLGDAVMSRLASFLWMIGTGAVALGIAVILDRTGPSDTERWLVAIGIPVAALGAGLWRNRDRPLQVFTLAVGVGLAVGGVAGLADVSEWAAGVFILAVAMTGMIVVLARPVQPEWAALTSLAVASIVGAMLLLDISETIGFSAVGISAACVLAIGLRRGRATVTVTGVIGFLIGLRGLLSETLRGPLATLVVALAALAVVVSVLIRYSRRRSVS